MKKKNMLIDKKKKELLAHCTFTPKVNKRNKVESGESNESNESGEGSSPSERAGKRMYERWQHSAKKMLSSPARKRNGSNGSGGGGRKDVRVKHYQTSEELALMAW